MIKIFLALLITILVLTCGCTGTGGTHTQFTDDIHGTVVEKRVDSWGEIMKQSDYVIIMNDGYYYEAVVSFQKYASVKIGDTL